MKSTDTQLQIELDANRNVFAPGETLRGQITWQGTSEVTRGELRLFWYTEGRGTQDIKIVDQQNYEPAHSSDQHPFEFTAPDKPVSFSGKLVSFIWALELVLYPSKQSTRAELIISPTGRELKPLGKKEAARR